MISTYHSRARKYRRADEYPEESTGDRSGLRRSRAAVVRVAAAHRRAYRIW